jgi:oligosaccharyltransferase complex subunit gamma
LFPLIFLFLLVSAAYGAYVLWWSPLVQHPFIWAFGSIAVVWFSVSGGMFNIIRGMPMFIRDKDGKLQFFLSGRYGPALVLHVGEKQV